ncbi:helix-turn-helix domain-containing protein [Aureibacillus halotolerans]|uniref:Helix-turn-helix protein n=1 Tax=Aureibacillus halotolerans TaxID=1508390 RepID=A0A4R6U1M0_9BACI|nr:helix-turn-helix transcriptional regulator [Aureibacillus halotolerans]TDQ39192.1 helix-turn-helix protein [Aureibacillus halotolerans]
MDKRAKILEEMIEEQGYSKKAFAEMVGIPPTTLRSMLQRGVGKASVDNVIKVCRALGITTEELEAEASSGQVPNVEGNVELTSKDERDIQKELQSIIDGLNIQNGYAAFDGQSIEEMDEDDKELLINSLEQSLRIAKRMAKQKFTPKKYK